MSFPRYEAYRGSGQERIGQLPSHWQVAQTKRLAEFVYGDALPAGTRDETGEVPVFGSNGAFGFHDSPNTHAPAIFIGRKGSCGALKWSEVPSFGIDTVYFVDPEHTKVHLRWLFWALHIIGLESMSQDTGVPGLSRETAYAAELPLPPPSEQFAIAKFLDRETAKIDALVEEQQRFIALLKEKRQAVISHAVTKGLDPNAPMKDSGVEWLGEAPAHWGRSRLKYVSSHVVDCLHTTPTYDGDVEYPAVRTADVERGVLLLDQVRLVARDVYEERIQRLRPIAYDILYSREGERFGMAALAPRGIDLCLGQRMMMFRIKNSDDPTYMMWVLNSECVFQQVLSRVAGSTSPHINIADVANFDIPHPPREEQAGIAMFINSVVVQLDALISKAREAIALLQERRSALISVAVSGKIDVRALTPAVVQTATSPQRDSAEEAYA